MNVFVEKVAFHLKELYHIWRYFKLAAMCNFCSVLTPQPMLSQLHSLTPQAIIGISLNSSKLFNQWNLFIAGD